MDFTTRRASQITPKLISTYNKLFQGLSPQQISPNSDTDRFYSDLLSLNVDNEYLQRELNSFSKDICLGRLKPFLNELFQSCMKYARTANYEDIKKVNAIKTLSILIRCVLAKNLTGWEIMEVLAGSVSQSDVVFMEFTGMINDIISDENAPAAIRHQVLQLALVYACSVVQLSPGAYFLRRDLFPAISTFVKSPETEQYTFEAALFLSILANYHKSDAAKLNHYLKRIQETDDKVFMRKICWASNFALDAAVKAYQEISDDSVSPTLKSSFGSMMNLLRPDRVLSPAITDAPRELYKNQPIEACVVLLPMYEFIRTNTTFSSVLVEYMSPEAAAESGKLSPPPFTILTLVSYILTHASSTFSPRSLAYANLSLNTLLAFVENHELIEAFSHRTAPAIRLCRQRPPVLPIPRPDRAPVCSVLDCCVLWLRHNLHLRLETNSYTNCIWVCYRVIWFLQDRHIRLEYEWQELWSAVLGLLNFLATKIGSLTTTGGVERLLQETIRLLDLALSKSETYLPTPRALHEFIYELLRSAHVLKKQAALLDSLAMPDYSATKRASLGAGQTSDALVDIVSITEFYEIKVTEAGARTAKDAMRVVAREIEADGLHGAKVGREVEPPKRTDEVLGFARYACVDGLALMP